MIAVRRLRDRYVHYKHRLASANIRLAAHVAKRFRHHSLAYSRPPSGSRLWADAGDRPVRRVARHPPGHLRDLVDPPDASDRGGPAVAPRQPLARTTSRNSASSSRNPKHWPTAASTFRARKNSPRRTGSSLEHLTHLQTATRTPVSLNAVLDDDSDFKLTEAMPDTGTLVMQEYNERQEALGFLMENLRPRERKVLDLRFGLTGNGTHSLRQIGHLLRISKERVRQIQNRALEKLRASAERVGWEPTLLLE